MCGHGTKRCIDVRRDTAANPDVEETLNDERQLVSVELSSLVLTDASLIRATPRDPPAIHLSYRGSLLHEDLWERHARVRVTTDDGVIFDCRVLSVDSKKGIIAVVSLKDNINAPLACAALDEDTEFRLSTVRIETTRDPHKYRRTFSVPEDFHPIN